MHASKVDIAIASLAALLVCASSACKLEVEPLDPSGTEGAVGIDVTITNGQAAPLSFVAGTRSYVNNMAFRVLQRDFPARMFSRGSRLNYRAEATELH